MAKSLSQVGNARMVRVRHETARSCSVGGRLYEADAEGRILVPAEAADELAAHGFSPVEDADPSSVDAETRARRD